MSETMTKQKRMLGQVELTVYGSVTKTQMTNALKSLIARSQRLTGALLIAYPVYVDAVLVSDQGQVTVIDLMDSKSKAESQERQDRAFWAVDRLLRMNQKLMNGRTPKIAVQTVSICAGIQQTQPNHTDHPLVSLNTAMAKLEQFQEKAPEGITGTDVVEQIMWMPQP